MSRPPVAKFAEYHISQVKIKKTVWMDVNAEVDNKEHFLVKVLIISIISILGSCEKFNNCKFAAISKVKNQDYVDKAT